MLSRTVLALLILITLLTAGVTPQVYATGHSSTQDTACSFPLTTTDATGEHLTVQSKPSRIVALAPSDAQLLWEINASDHVVGMPVSRYTAYLDNHDSPRDITGQDGLTVIIEQVVDLEPDLVLAGNITNHDTIDRLREANLTVYHFRAARDIDDIIQNTRTTGVLTGECQGATVRVEWMNQEISNIEQATANQPEPLVFLAYRDIPARDS